MKVILIACLIALCYAQPAPTEISETFTSKVIKKDYLMIVNFYAILYSSP